MPAKEFVIPFGENGELRLLGGGFGKALFCLSGYIGVRELNITFAKVVARTSCYPLSYGRTTLVFEYRIKGPISRPRKLLKSVLSKSKRAIYRARKEEDEEQA